MKVLLIGEYSRLHNSLKEGLLQQGHEVLLIGSGDGFKNFPVDINISSKIISNSFLLFFAKIVLKLTGVNITKIEIALKIFKALPKLKGFDVVQLINEDSLKTNINLQIWFLKKIIKNNKKIFLLSCGADYVSLKYAFDKKIKYSILTPLQNDYKLKKQYQFIIKYLSKENYKLHNFLYNNVNGVIASDMDYHIPLKGNPLYLGLIPNPINTKKLIFNSRKLEDKIHIFHGVNTNNAAKKGNIFFDEALKIITKKYPDKVKVFRTEDIPYSEYIKLYNHSQILLDQVYSFDQGYNALEAMAKGKVVFTGAELEWLDYYGLTEDTVVINALPDAAKIASKLEWLILNPEKIIEISHNARAFILKNHNYIDSAKTYIEKWTN